MHTLLQEKSLSGTTAVILMYLVFRQRGALTIISDEVCLSPFGQGVGEAGELVPRTCAVRQGQSILTPPQLARLFKAKGLSSVTSTSCSIRSGIRSSLSIESDRLYAAHDGLYACDVGSTSYER